MSIHRSYFSKNNTIIANSYVNTAKNPVTQLFYGKSPYPTCVFTGLSGDSCNNQSGCSGGSSSFAGIIADEQTSSSASLETSIRFFNLRFVSGASGSRDVPDGSTIPPAGKRKAKFPAPCQKHLSCQKNPV